jgi:hypothetical protein
MGVHLVHEFTHAPALQLPAAGLLTRTNVGRPALLKKQQQRIKIKHRGEGRGDAAFQPLPPSAHPAKNGCREQLLLVMSESAV